MTPSREDSPVERHRKALQLEEARHAEEQKQQDIERFRNEILERRREEERRHVFIQKIHAVKWAAPVAAGAWAAGLLLFMLAWQQPFSVAAGYSAASFGLIAFLLTYLVVLEKRLAGHPRPRMGVASWIWFLTGLALFVAWMANQEVTRRTGPVKTAEVPASQPAEAMPMTGIGQVRMPQPPPRKEVPKEAAPVQARNTGSAADKSDAGDARTEPRLPCVIKPVMTDEEIQRCRDS